jgi:uncharacterized membrane protein
MPRKVEITVPPRRREEIVARISAIPGVAGIRVQEGISRKPPGDVIAVELTNRALPELARTLAAAGVGLEDGASFSTSESISLVSASTARDVVTDTSEATWEEMEVVIAKNSNITPSAAAVMAIAGVLATIGIATNALHIVIGAMLIAPGFQPIVRIALGAVAGSDAWKRGVANTLKGYLALAAGAAATAVFLLALGRSPLGTDEPSYLAAGGLVSYWTTLTVPSLLVTFVGGAAGAVLIATNRAVLTAGVMVALALVPSATIAAAGLVAGEPGMAAAGAMRWIVEVLLVLFSAVLVMAVLRARVHRRPSLL